MRTVLVLVVQIRVIRVSSPYPIYIQTKNAQSELRIVTFKIRPEMLERLDKLALELGVYRSDLLRVGILRVLRDPPTEKELREAFLKALYYEKKGEYLEVEI